MGWVSTSYYDGSMPVYRFWNETTKDHFYTADASEKAQLEANYYSGRDDYVYEGIGYPAFMEPDTINQLSYVYRKNCSRPLKKSVVSRNVRDRHNERSVV